VLQGIHLDEVDGVPSAIAADGYRLTVAACDYGPLRGQTLPPVMRLMLRHFVESEAVCLGIDDGYRLHILGETRFAVVPLMGERYPDVLPLLSAKVGDIRLVLPIDSFERAVQRVYVISDLVAHRAEVSLRLDEDEAVMLLTTQREDDGATSSIEERIPADIGSAQVGTKVALNIGFVRDFIRTVSWDTETVGIDLDGPTQPVVFRADDRANMRALIMPMSVGEVEKSA
jgi:DNA polymerase III sliding clamp (beta) subunit (PCNA family)